MIETGKNVIPGAWIEMLCDHYHLKPYPRKIPKIAAGKSKTHIRIDPKESANYKREPVIAFGDAFDQIDEEIAEKVQLMLLDSVK